MFWLQHLCIRQPERFKYSQAVLHPQTSLVCRLVSESEERVGKATWVTEAPAGGADSHPRKMHLKSEVILRGGEWKEGGKLVEMIVNLPIVSQARG